MPVVRIEDIGHHVGETVTLRGWLYHKRSSGKVHFLQVRDGTGILQCVMGAKDVAPDVFEAAAHLSQESSLEVTGTVRADARAPGGHELGASDVRVVALASDFPIGPKEHGIDFLMDHRHLWLRSRRQAAILRVRAEVIRAIRDFFDSNGFVLVDSPILTPNAVEGTSTLFETDYFDTKAYLTQSGQLYAEAGAMALGKVYCFGPTFRAEKSKTRRHLTEFWMCEPEVAYMDLEGDMDLAEDLLVAVVARVLDRRRPELEAMERDVAPLERVVRPFPRITYAEAVRMVNEAGHAMAHGADFGAEDETVLSGLFDRPVLVHRYPADVKAFYMKRDPENPDLALCVDVMAPEGYGEIIGGSQREDDLETLERRVREHDLPREAFSWYLDLRRYGTVPHSGFGLGLERTLAWICGLHHLREAIPFPRTMTRLSP